MISIQQINRIDRAIDKVYADGYTIDQGYELVVGVDNITVRDVVKRTATVVFDYKTWEYGVKPRKECRQCNELCRGSDCQVWMEIEGVRTCSASEHHRGCAKRSAI